MTGNKCIRCGFESDLCWCHRTGGIYPQTSTQVGSVGPISQVANPKDAIGTAKVGLSCVPSQVLLEIGLAMTEGSRKYARHNYRAAGVRTSIYYDALMRHMMAFWEGENLDPDSGLSHLTKAIATLVVLRDGYITGNVVDDRPPVTQEKDWLTKLNNCVKVLIEKYPNPKEPFTELKNG